MAKKKEVEDKKLDPNDDPFRQHESVAGFSGTPHEGVAPPERPKDIPENAVWSPCGWIVPVTVTKEKETLWQAK